MTVGTSRRKDGGCVVIDVVYTWYGVCLFREGSGFVKVAFI